MATVDFGGSQTHGISFHGICLPKAYEEYLGFEEPQNLPSQYMLCPSKGVVQQSNAYPGGRCGMRHGFATNAIQRSPKRQTAPDGRNNVFKDPPKPQPKRSGAISSSAKLSRLRSQNTSEDGLPKTPMHSALGNVYESGRLVCEQGEVALDPPYLGSEHEPQESAMANASMPSGPCSGVWPVPPLGPRRKPISVSQPPKKRDHQGQSKKPELVYEDPALTRELGSCIRCKFQKIRCKPSPLGLPGICGTCLDLNRPTLTNIPCLRYRISDASLFREQKAPWPHWTRRWDSMEIIDIKLWASTEIKNVRITYGFGDASYEVKLRRFVPLPNDMLHQVWVDRGITKYHAIPPYAIADMHEAATEIQRHVDSSIAQYLIGFVGDSDPLFWDTFREAFQWAHASRSVEGELVLNSLRLWTVARMSSNPEWICGGDPMGSRIDDPSSPYHNRVPLPPVMNAQLEVIMYSTLLRPLRDKVLTGLESLLRENLRRNWLTIYFTLFILLHSCSLTTRRDEQFARRMHLSTKFANPRSIEEHHVGVLNMLAHFHYESKGRYPITLAENPTALDQFATAAELPLSLAEFVKQSAERVRARAQYIRKVRATGNVGNDFYFVSQLFDRDWKPTQVAN